MTISSMSAPAFEWDAETEEGEGPTVSDAADDGILPVPESLSVIGASSRLTASCVDPLSDELQFIFEYKKSADSAWSQISAPIATYTIQTAALAAGTYNVRAKFYGGDYVDAANVTL
jgi:hypothetical protein